MFIFLVRGSISYPTPCKNRSENENENETEILMFSCIFNDGCQIFMTGDKKFHSHYLSICQFIVIDFQLLCARSNLIFCP
jgi:hypothetical protein